MRGALLAALLVASFAPAAAQYTQAQAQTFLQMKSDVLAAVAPSIDPVHKLAARVSLTFLQPNTTRIIKDTNRDIITAMGDGVLYAIVNAQRVAAFQAFGKGADKMTRLVAAWAGVPEANVLVVVDDGPNGVPSTMSARNGGAQLYNITVMPNPNTLNTNPYFTIVDTVDVLLSKLPARDANYPCTACGERCSCQNICYFAQQPAFTGTTWNIDGGDCNSTFVGGGVGLRYVVDMFSNYDTPNAVVVGDLAQRWAATTSVWPAVPNTTLQYTMPVAEAGPGPLSMTATVFASIGVSAAVLVGGVLLWFRK